MEEELGIGVSNDLTIDPFIVVSALYEQKHGEEGVQGSIGDEDQTHVYSSLPAVL